MKIQKAASIPLALHDPYFSLWSNTDTLNAADPIHWAGAAQELRGYVKIDGIRYCFMGAPELHEVIPQKSLDITATSTTYTFENESLQMTLKFTSPLLLNDLTVCSRPITYMDFVIEKKTDCEVQIELELGKNLTTPDGSAPMIGASFQAETFHYASMGKAQQYPLGDSGDNTTIDWGYIYLACQCPYTTIAYDPRQEKIYGKFPIRHDQTIILAYDDLLSINYFGQWRKGYWTKAYGDILTAIGAAFDDQRKVKAKAEALDQEIQEKAEKIGGEDYAFLCNMSYRHSIAAHKIIEDEEGNVIFLSKENDSNGCIGTVDVSYPSTPLYFLYNPELVKGMLRPVFKFASCKVWEADYAPHDVGRYPYAWGQVYGLRHELNHKVYNGDTHRVYPPTYMYPAGSDIYEFESQMPVEECGNMLVMTAEVCRRDGNPDFAAPYMAILDQWVKYLIEYGEDPGEQLCTDDFAGHLAHNVNLSAKAIMGVEAYSIIKRMQGDEAAAAQYHEKAKAMAVSLEERSSAGDHYALAYGNPESWSLKYNLVWDLLFDSHLFSEEIYEKELAWYVAHTNEFGTPLDSRRDYTKSDWILWVVRMARSEEQRRALIAPVAHYLRETTTRVPFSDWYETKKGTYCQFIARSVQGGIFMPLMGQMGSDPVNKL